MRLFCSARGQRAGAVVLATLLVTLLAPLRPAAAAVPAFCGLGGMATFVWDGGGSTSNWGEAANWSPDQVPGVRRPVDATYTDYACIPAGFSVTIRTGDSAHLLALDSRGSLTVARGAKLLLEGDQARQPSYVTTLAVTAGTLGGAGLVRIGKRLTWRSLSTGAATQTTRELEPQFARPFTVPGRTVVDPGAAQVVNGLGVNLVDRRVIDNLGTTTLAGSAAYIAADYGTTFNNTRTAASVGRFVLRNDRGYYQGANPLGLSARGSFVNTGTVVKSAGAGTSVVDAEYADTVAGSPYRGRVQVKSGRVSIYSDRGLATVSPGGSFGTGGCPDAEGSQCSSPVATSADPQVSAVALPAIAGAPASPVSITELAADPAAGPGGAPPRGRPVDIATPKAVGTATRPLQFTFRLDASVLAAADTPQAMVVTHDGVRVPDCSTPGTASPSPCISDRRLVGGDVELVALTLQNGRWKIYGKPT